MSVAATAAPTWVAGRAAAAPKDKPPKEQPPKGPTPTLTTTLRRREDQLHLDFEFYNLELNTSGPTPVLERRHAHKVSHVVVVFTPQHVMEQALFEADPEVTMDVDPPSPPDPTTSDDPDDFPPPVGNRLSGPSRLAFRIPDSVSSIPFTPAGLLDWTAWEASVVPVMLGIGPPKKLGQKPQIPELQEPTALHTAIELPWWLVLSPTPAANWNHATGPVTHGGNSELWHTRLASEDLAAPEIRAVWARDPDFETYVKKFPDTSGISPAHGEAFSSLTVGMPFRTPLSPRDRFDLVTSTSHWDTAGYLPLAARADQLMLSPLGGWLEIQGAWDTSTSGTSLESWRHRATLGRDHYVRVVRSGFLFPFGHGASLVKVTERKFRTVESRTTGKRRIAYLFQRYFIVVRQRRLDYGGELHRKEGKAFPFRRVDITTLITPNLDRPRRPDTGSFTPLLFQPEVGGEPFRFDMVGTDWSGQTIDFEAPVVFVDSELAFDPADPLSALRSWYNDPNSTAANATDFRGAAVAVAEPDEPGSTDLEVHSFTFGAEEPTVTDLQVLKSARQPPFFPTMATAQVRLAAAEVAVGGGLGPLPEVVFNPDYINVGFETKGEVFVDLTSPADLSFASMSAGDRSGGVATPNLAISALSRQTGTVGGPPGEFQMGSFKPAEFFPDTATILGDIKLKDVVAEVTSFDPTDERILRLTTREEPDGATTRLTWRPQLTNSGQLFIAELGVMDASLVLDATITIPDNAPGTFTVVGDLRDFELQLLDGSPFIAIEFDRLRFQSENGKKTDVDVDIRQVKFIGPLEFVDQLRNYLTFGTGDFAINVTPSHVAAGYELAIPSIELGVFALKNLAFVAGLTLPFDGQPARVRFGFSTAENPFQLSVMMFGGSGFFDLALGADGVESMHMSLEFGANLAIDFGVASGSVSLTAGIYLAIADTGGGEELRLTGFLKLKGEVEVLGLISLSLLMKASFTYSPTAMKAIAKAEVVVEVDLLVYSGEVVIPYEKRFGNGADPTFGEAMTQSEWDTYSDAFAAIGV